MKPKKRMASQSSASTRVTTTGSMKDNSNVSVKKKDTLRLPESQHPRCTQLLQSKMYSSTESDTSNQSCATTTSDM